MHLHPDAERMSQQPLTSDEAPVIPSRVLGFLAEKIDTVPQLEALLLLWQDPARCWRAEQIGARLYVSEQSASAILRSLQMQGLAACDQDGAFCYCPAWDGSGDLMAEVALAYRHNLIYIATLIHSRGSSAVRAFARAFDLKKDR